jgi:hypothetical protein
MGEILTERKPKKRKGRGDGKGDGRDGAGKEGWGRNWVV